MESIPYETHGENLRKSVQTNLSTEISQKFDVSMIWYVSYQRVFGNCLIPVMVFNHRCQWFIFAKSSFFRIPMPLIDQSFFTAYWYQSRFPIASFYYKGTFLGDFCYISFILWMSSVQILTRQRLMDHHVGRTDCKFLRIRFWSIYRLGNLWGILHANEKFLLPRLKTI